MQCVIKGAITLTTNHSLTIDEAAKLLRTGEAVAFPTETVYGLGADATSDDAVSKIFAAKGRPGDNPLIVHIGAIEDLQSVAAEVPDVAKKLMDAFWPGALTIVLPKGSSVSDKVTAGLNTVGVRMPSHPVALELLRKTKLPISAPSANISGRPSPTTAQHVIDDLDGKIAGVVDGGSCEIGLESTVIDCSAGTPVILRPGGVTWEQIEAVIGNVNVAESVSDDESPKSPGMKYKHYAPAAPMFVVRGSHEFFDRVINDARADGKRAGILVTDENRDRYTADVILTCGSGKDASSIARELYDVIRRFDAYDLDVIYCESFGQSGIGAAIMNRLLKASGNRIIEEL